VRQGAQPLHGVPEQLVALAGLRPAQAAADDVRQAIGFHDDDVIAGADGRRQPVDPPLVARCRAPGVGGQLPAGITVRQVIGDDHRNGVSPRRRQRHLTGLPHVVRLSGQPDARRDLRDLLEHGRLEPMAVDLQQGGGGK
jgi:hypothetical protein